MQPKFWNIDLTNDEAVMNASLTRVPGENADEAQHNALMTMRVPGEWRVTAIDRA